jgi:hypothetical protein
MDARFQELQDEIERLKVEVSTPRQSLDHVQVAAMKNVTLVAGIKDWTCVSKGRSVHEVSHR